MTLKLEGIWCPMATPLNASGEGINLDSAKRLVNFLIENGIDGLLPLGTSGEFALLSDEERASLLKQVIDSANGKVPVVAGVSDPSIGRVIESAKMAKDYGADGVIATPPYYYAAGNDGLYDFYKQVSESIELPLMIYNIPDWVGKLVPVDVVKRLADEKLVVGMKYTDFNFLNLLDFIETSGKEIAIFTGEDALASSTLEFGGNGAVIGVTNVAPNLSASIYDSFVRGDLQAAREAQKKLVPLIKGIGLGKFPSGLKAAMNLLGLNVGPAKTPLPPLDESEKSHVRELLKQAGLTGDGS
jgi:4-hydroxy-tetrahydrodipicolinate synthase